MEGGWKEVRDKGCKAGGVGARWVGHQLKPKTWSPNPEP